MRSRPLAELTEKQWDAQLFNSQKGLATMLGWRLAYHTLRSKGSQPGFPDRVLARDRVLFIELKREGGKATRKQAEWLDGLAAAGSEVYLWRPGDLDEVGRVLSKRWLHVPGAPEGAVLIDGAQAFRPGSLWVAGKGRRDET